MTPWLSLRSATASHNHQLSKADQDLRGTEVEPHTCYLICGTPRSGSALLVEALTNTGVAGHPAEYFWRGDEPMWAERWGLTNYTYADYFAAALHYGTTPNGVFGAKMMWWDYFDDFLRKVRSMPGHDVPEVPALLSRIFPDLHYIWLSRRDKVRQAISHWRAMQTGVWGETEDATIKPAKEPDYNFEAIHHLVQGAAESDAAWAAYFTEHGIEPCKVVYEDFVDEYASTLLRILGFLGISRPDSLGVEKRRLRKQADAMTEMWVHRYLSAVSQ